MTTYTGATLTATVARTTSSAGTFLAATWDVYLPVPVQLQSFVSDILKAGTYSFKCDGVTLATVVVGADATAAVSFTPAAPLELAAGKHTLALTSTAARARYYNSSGTAGVTGTGADYVGKDEWQEAAGTSVPGTLNFKAPDGVLLDVLAPTADSATSFTEQVWPVTFDAAVLLVGVGKRTTTVDATGYRLSVDGTALSTVVKNDGRQYRLAFPVSPGRPLAAGARSFKMERLSAANKAFSYRAGTGATPTGAGHVTAWGAWAASPANQPSAALFYALAVAPPTGMAGDPDYFSVDLTWVAPAAGGSVDGYRVRVDGGAPDDVGNVLAHTVAGLTPATSYTFEVQAYGAWGDSSAWVPVVVETLTLPPAGYYRVDLTVGDHSWSIDRGDAPSYGPILPIALGWDIPDAGYFPAQASLQTLNLKIQTADASDLADVVKGTFVTMAMYVDPDPDADPWQWFAGIVTQLDGETVPSVTDPEALDYRVTIYAGDTTAILDNRLVGYANDWPIESIGDRVQRICAEAAVGYDTGAFLGTGLEGWLAGRNKGAPMSALAAIRTAMKDAGEEYDSDFPNVYWGRFVFHHDLDSGDVIIDSFLRRVIPGATVTLDGAKVRAEGSWTKLPGPHAATWGVVDDVVYGTPDDTVPFYLTSSLLDYTGDPPGSDTNYSTATRDNLGRGLLPDGSTALDGWSTRTLRYLSYLDSEPVTWWASFTGASGLFSAPWGNGLAKVIPVVITPIGPELEVNAVDYLAGTLTGARLVIPPGGDHYVDFRLRAELLPGTDLP